jgi:hypothetical protein
VKIFARLAIAVVAVLLLWAGFAYTVSRPVDARGYLRTALQVAEGAHDAAATGALIGRQQLGDKVFGTFTVAAYDDAAKGLAGAAHKLAEQAPPDDGSAALRDRLAPLVQTAVRELGDAARADDNAALRTAVSGLDDVADQLSDVIEQYR